jgi:hypothetical protein
MARKSKKKLEEEAFNKKYFEEDALATAEMKKALAKESLLYCRFCNHHPRE